jgi:hypothetical protein
LSRCHALLIWYKSPPDDSDFHPLSGALNVETMGIAPNVTTQQSQEFKLSKFTDAVKDHEDIEKEKE